VRIVVESAGTPKYDLTNPGSRVQLAVRTDQAAFTLSTEQAATAAREARDRRDTVIGSSSEKPKTSSSSASSSKPAPAAPAHPLTVAAVTKQPAAKPAVAKHVVAAKPAASVKAPAPVKVAKAPTPVKVAQASAPAKPAQAPAPVVVARATPNPWLPGGKYYCKVPGMPGYRGGAMPSHEAAGHAPAGPPGMGMMPSGARNVNLDVKNADILDVLKLLANESGQNIVATQNVKGTVTVSLHNVPLSTALDLIVRTNGLDYRKLGNIYVVGTSDDLNREFGSVGQEATQTVAFPIKYANPADLGKQLAGVIPASSFTVDPRTDTVIVSGTPQVIQSARNFLALSDVPAPQVNFEVKVLDVSHNGNSNNGIQFVGSSDFDLFENKLASGTIVVPVTVQSGNTIGPQPFTRNALFIQAKINYLIAQNDAQLLANPRVTALDNNPASLLIGQTYPLVYYDPRSGQFQAQYIDIGVKLIITPVVNTDGYITTTMHVERSFITGLVQQFPILDNRKADSILRVKDGDTIVLGGLLDDETTTSVSKVPLLGDIPILGAFFKNVQKTKTHQEVVFLITPHIVGEH
jgi:type IV pilus secretin PilQ/predicted competence protein